MVFFFVQKSKNILTRQQKIGRAQGRQHEGGRERKKEKKRRDLSAKHCVYVCVLWEARAGTKKKSPEFARYSRPTLTKETALERADFTLQLLMFVTAEKKENFYNLLSPQFLSAVVPMD